MNERDEVTETTKEFAYVTGEVVWVRKQGSDESAPFEVVNHPEGLLTLKRYEGLQGSAPTAQDGSGQDSGSGVAHGS